MFSQVINVLCIVICVCYAAPTSKDNAEATILEYENENDGNGNYYFRYVTSNGIKREERGTLVNSDTSDAYIQVEGTVSYINPNGEETLVKYTADDQGYRILPSEKDFILPPPLGAVPSGVLASLLGGG